MTFAQPGQLFEDLGITYIGVMPGHDRRLLEETFRRALALTGPVIVHVRTQKGKGYKPAEADQDLVPRRRSAADGARASHRYPRPDRTGTLANGDPMASSAAGGALVT